MLASIFALTQTTKNPRHQGAGRNSHTHIRVCYRAAGAGAAGAGAAPEAGAGAAGAGAAPGAGVGAAGAGAAPDAGAGAAPEGCGAAVSLAHMGGTCSGATVLVIRVQAQVWESFHTLSSKMNSTLSALRFSLPGTLKLTVARTELGVYPGRMGSTTWKFAPDSCLERVMVSKSSGADWPPWTVRILASTGAAGSVAVVSTVLRSAAVGSVAAAAVVRAAEVVSLEPLLSLSSLEQALRVSAAAAAVTMAMVFVVKDFNSSPWLLWCVRLASRLASRSAFHGTRGSSLMRSLSKSDVFHCNPAEHSPLSHPPVCSLAWVLWHAWVHD